MAGWINIDWHPSIGFQSPGDDDFRDFLSGYASMHGVELAEATYLNANSEALVSQIRALTTVHSVPTPLPPPTISATTGSGTQILGEVDNPFFCDPQLAKDFKDNCIAKTSGYYHIVRRSNRPEYDYQRKKCGSREYSLRTDASWSSRRPMADGLNWEPANDAKPGYAWGCCILDAKYVHDTDTTYYQPFRDFKRKLARRTRFIVPPKAKRWRRRFSLGRYFLIRTQEIAQAGVYFGVTASREIPYTRFLYICSETVARDYFAGMVGRTGPVAGAVHSRKRARHKWYNPDDSYNPPS